VPIEIGGRGPYLLDEGRGRQGRAGGRIVYDRGEANASGRGLAVVGGEDATMVPMEWEAAEDVLAWEDGSRRTLAIHHALTLRRGVVWADRPVRPTSVVLARRSPRGWEAFGSGEPGPAVPWLSLRREPIALMAPESWEAELARAARRVGAFERADLEVRYLPEPRGHAVRSGHVGPPITVRRLTLADAPALVAALPDGALRSWASADEALGRGAAFGVPRGATFLAVAWIVEQDRHLDAVGVFTEERFRRLGLGRAACRGLIDHVLDRRRKVPLWAAGPDNDASLALARSLGFTIEMRETVLRFPTPGLAQPGQAGLLT
jgi:GNAT superfamily N-acetyltransferase